MDKYMFLDLQITIAQGNLVQRSKQGLWVEQIQPWNKFASFIFKKWNSIFMGSIVPLDAYKLSILAINKSIRWTGRDYSSNLNHEMSVLWMRGVLTLAI